MKITAEFITSAAQASDFPRDDVPEIALVGRSNVGKSSLLNALVRARVARTSARPGKTRLANIYRVRRSSASLYVVDLPGYGYAPDREAIADVTTAWFGRNASGPGRPAVGSPVRQVHLSALLLVDARHPGLESDIEAWRWLDRTAIDRSVIATKIDKLARGQRIRAQRAIESVFEASVLPVSAVTGEGLDELWKLMDRLANSRSRSNRNRLTLQPRDMPAAELPTR